MSYCYVQLVSSMGTSCLDSRSFTAACVFLHVRPAQEKYGTMTSQKSGSFPKEGDPSVDPNLLSLSILIMGTPKQVPLTYSKKPLSLLCEFI